MVLLLLLLFLAHSIQTNTSSKNNYNRENRKPLELSVFSPVKRAWLIGADLRHNTTQLNKNACLEYPLTTLWTMNVHVLIPLEIFWDRIPMKNTPQSWMMDKTKPTESRGKQLKATNTAIPNCRECKLNCVHGNQLLKKFSCTHWHWT